MADVDREQLHVSTIRTAPRFWPMRFRPEREPELHLTAELVSALGIVGAEHPGQTHRDPFGIKVFLEPGAQERRKRGPEKRRAQVEKLGQPERV